MSEQTKSNKWLLENIRMQRTALINAITAKSIEDFALWSQVFINAQKLETPIRRNPDPANFRKSEIEKLERPQEPEVIHRIN